MKRFIVATVVCLCLIHISDALAILEIEITQGADTAMPIAIAPFESEAKSPPPEDIASIVSADLRRSGQFVPVDPQDYPQANPRENDFDYKSWRQQGIEHVVIGSVSAGRKNTYTIDFRLFESVRGDQLVGHRIKVRENELRKAAHKISDIIFEQITVRRGAFSTSMFLEHP